MITSLRPDRITCRDWRGGQIIAIGATTTIKLMAEANIVHTYTGVANALVPVDARSVGCPVACRISGSGVVAVANYVIEEVIGSTFPWNDAPRNNAASVAAGIFTPGIVPRSVTGEPLTWWVE